MTKAPKKKTDTAGVGHNSEAMEAQLHIHMGKLRDGRSRIADAQALLKSVKKEVKRDRDAAKQDFLLKVLDAALDAEEINDRDAENEAIQRYFVFDRLGLPTGMKQGDLFGEPADTVRDMEYWGGRGYNAGLKLLPASPPDAMPAQFMQHWLEKHAAGAERTNWAAATLTNVEKRGSGGGPTADEIARGDPLLS